MKKKRYKEGVIIKEIFTYILFGFFAFFFPILSLAQSPLQTEAKACKDCKEVSLRKSPSLRAVAQYGVLRGIGQGEGLAKNYTLFQQEDLDFKAILVVEKKDELAIRNLILNSQGKSFLKRLCKKAEEIFDLECQKERKSNKFFYCKDVKSFKEASKLVDAESIFMVPFFQAVNELYFKKNKDPKKPKFNYMYTLFGKKPDNSLKLISSEFIDIPTLLYGKGEHYLKDWEFQKEKTQLYFYKSGFLISPVQISKSLKFDLGKKTHKLPLIQFIKKAKVLNDYKTVRKCAHLL